MVLELGESWPAWHPDVRRGTWRVDGLPSPVLTVLGTHRPGAVRTARREATAAVALRGKHVLPLLGIEPTGTHVAWVYPFEVLVSLAQLPPGALGCKAVATVVRDVARTLSDVPHPGPLPDQVLLDASGTVRIAHFVGPWEPGPAWTPPRQPGVPDADAAFRLGLLTALLLGTAPVVLDSALAHDAHLRRVLDRARDAAGGHTEQELLDLLRDLLAWDPRDRPSLGSVARRLDDVVGQSGGASLAATTAEGFASWLVPHRRGQAVADELSDFSAAAYETMEVATATHRTLDGEDELGDLEADDEPTVDSELGVVTVSERTPSSVIEFGSLPLRVGPPPQAVKPTPRLPEGFMGASDTTSTQVDIPAPAPVWLNWLSLVLAGAVIGLAAWLLLFS